MTAIQFIETYKTEKDASEGLTGLSRQSGYIGGRVLPDSPAKPGWRAQAFFELDGMAPDSWLPDGCRVVIIPRSLLWSVRRS